MKASAHFEIPDKVTSARSLVRQSSAYNILTNAVVNSLHKVSALEMDRNVSNVPALAERSDGIMQHCWDARLDKPREPIDNDRLWVGQGAEAFRTSYKIQVSSPSTKKGI